MLNCKTFFFLFFSMWLHKTIVKKTTCKGFIEMLVLMNWMSNSFHSHDPFSYSHHTKVVDLSPAWTANHAHKKRNTKQGTTWGRGERLPCEAENHPEPRHITAMKTHHNEIIKRGNKIYHQQYIITFHVLIILFEKDIHAFI